MFGVKQLEKVLLVKNDLAAVSIIFASRIQNCGKWDKHSHELGRYAEK